MRIFVDLAVEVAYQEPRLHFQKPPYRDPIAEHRMRHLLIEPAFVSRDEGAPGVRLEVDGRAGGYKSFGLHFAVVDRLDHGGIRQDGAEGLHHVERERGPAEPRLVIEAEIRIQDD